MAVYIAAGKRTAFGAFGGSLKNFTASQVRSLAYSFSKVPPLPADPPPPHLQLGGIAAKAALAELPEGVQVDSVHFGCVPS